MGGGREGGGDRRGDDRSEDVEQTDAAAGPARVLNVEGGCAGAGRVYSQTIRSAGMQ